MRIEACRDAVQGRVWTTRYLFTGRVLRQEFVGLLRCLDRWQESQLLRRAGESGDSATLRELDSMQRTVLGLFVKQKSASSSELATYLDLKPRNASILANKWIERGFFELDNPSKRARRYRLTAKYEALIAQ